MSSLDNAPLPFDLDVPSASAWMGTLPVGNIRRCCQEFFPVVQALNRMSVPASLRFAVLELWRPILNGMVRGLLPYFLDKPFPLDAKTRKVASLAVRLHLEFAQGYRQLADAADFEETFPAASRAQILERALDHLAQASLRSAQMYEVSPKNLWSEFARVSACLRALRERTPAEDPETDRASKLESMARGIVLFRLAAPGRLEQGEMQSLLTALVDARGSMDGAAGMAEPVRATDLCCDRGDGRHVLPRFVTPGDARDFECLATGNVVGALKIYLRGEQAAAHDFLKPLLLRLGGQLPCPEKPATRMAKLTVGFKEIDAALRELESKRRLGVGAADLWAGSSRFDLAPAETPLADRDHRSASRLTGAKSTVQVQVTEMPGFYLADLGPRALPAGQLIGLNSDDAWIQLAVIRGAQTRDGRHWYAFEVVGMEPRRGRLKAYEDGKEATPCLLFRQPEDSGSSVQAILAESKWRSGDVVRLDDESLPRRIAKLLEGTSSFCQVMLTPPEANSAADGV